MEKSKAVKVFLASSEELKDEYDDMLRKSDMLHRNKLS